MGAVGWSIAGEAPRIVPGPTATPPIARIIVPPEAALTPLTCDTPLAYGTEIVATSGTLAPDGHAVALAVELNPVYRMVPKGYMPDLEKRRIQLFDLATRTVRDLARGTAPVLWSASGQLLVFAEPQPPGHPDASELVVVEVATGREVTRLHAEPYWGGIGWDGDALLYQVASTLRRWTPSGDAAVLHVDGTPFIAVSADGRAATATTYATDPVRPARIAAIDLATGATVALPGARSTEWSPVGHRLLVEYGDRTELRDEDGAIATVPYPATHWGLQWAPDGRRPLFREPPAIVHSVTQVGPLVDHITIDRTPSLFRMPYEARAIGFSGDGRVLAAIDGDGWSPPTFRPYACRDEAFDAAPRPTTTTLYYVESDEPWAAARDGTAPSGWANAVTAELVAVGIHPIALDLVRPIPLEMAGRCATPECGNGYVLAATIPYDERERAFAHCFTGGDGTTYVPWTPARSNASYY
ncbi:MAG TPA: hypothetical protein VGA38_01765, partial [Candidatus Limnocylindria bacterium]